MPAATQEPTLVLTVDAGGSGVKASVICVRDWRVVARAQRAYAPSYPAIGLAEFDPDEWWARIQESCADAVARAGAAPDRYLAITCTAMRIPFVLLDRDGEPVAPGVLNLDERGAPFLSEVRDALGGDALYTLTGHWPAAVLGLPKLLWFAHRRPALWTRVRHVLQMHDWMLYRLCGVMTGEPSSASMAGLLDVSRRRWAVSLLAALGMAPELFPPLRDAGAVLGGLRAPVAHVLGLRPGTPVHVGGGDTHVACLGAGGVREGAVVVVGGSTTPIQLTTAAPLHDSNQRPWVSAHLRPGLWAAEVNAGATGMVYAWWRDVTMGGRPGVTPPDAAALDGLAASAPVGARDLLVTAPCPRWGEDLWQRRPPASLVGLTPGHTSGDVARAILECICYAVRGNLEQLEAAHGRPLGQITLTGGAGRSALWSQMLADVLGRSVRVPLVTEPSALGGARLILLDQPDAWGGPSPVQTYDCDPGRHAAYRPYYERYLAVYERLAEALGGSPSDRHDVASGVDIWRGETAGRRA